MHDALHPDEAGKMAPQKITGVRKDTREMVYLIGLMFDDDAKKSKDEFEKLDAYLKNLGDAEESIKSRDDEAA